MAATLTWILGFLSSVYKNMSLDVANHGAIPIHLCCWRDVGIKIEWVNSVHPSGATGYSADASGVLLFGIL